MAFQLSLKIPMINFPAAHDVYLKWRERKLFSPLFSVKSEWKINTREGEREWKWRMGSDSLKYVVRIFIYLRFFIISTTPRVGESVIRRNLQRDFFYSIPTFFVEQETLMTHIIIHWLKLSRIVTHWTFISLTFCHTSCDESLSWEIRLWPLHRRDASGDGENKDGHELFHDVRRLVNIFLFAQKWGITKDFLITTVETSPARLWLRWQTNFYLANWMEFGWLMIFYSGEVFFSSSCAGWKICLIFGHKSSIFISDGNFFLLPFVAQADSISGEKNEMLNRHHVISPRRCRCEKKNIFIFK